MPNKRDILFVHLADVPPKPPLCLDSNKVVHMARKGYGIKGDSFWGVGFIFALFFQPQGDDDLQLWILMSFLDQLCPWVGEVGLELSGVGWLRIEPIFLLCSFNNLWFCGVNRW